ncbi:bifunctional acetate--CoA ligase family protein/GNAT family N-acetyltransferase [Piscinibacter sakaiensis]|uniref:Acetyl-CoA synthetase (ADP-forming) alpha and beta chains, putative n=2 Tax=Piscinibacter sakaiensis TaxID=1547922 RepID=A0A0K8P595_PISS1|nr:bifunctional acetate--CoA ligase family protein/GNAT family N-acetyltransferase [Piscinibacter sakaiensis]GAP37669.1 acetyl-CoA synthetase (ADP-forming) alpha and beta chains, putative [Piscinibacter sakaiensis]
MDKHFLSPLFAPASILAMTGAPPAQDTAPADPDARLRQAVREALAADGYAGLVRHLDTQESGTLAELAQSRADLAVIALPPAEVPAALEIAGRLACRCALVVGRGFDAAAAAALQKIALRERMSLLGPNTLGFQCPPLKLNAGAVGPLARSGSLALVSQSGALTSAMLDWARRNGVGFSAVVSLGPHGGIDIAAVLDYFANDPRTQGVIVYLEGIADGRRFMSALRSAAHAKPTVVLKAGRRPAGNQAAQTHSRAIVGSDDVFDAALRRAGAVRVDSFVELFSAAKCLASRYRPVDRRLAIVTNGGGPGVLAADRVNQIGLQLGRLSAPSVAALQPLLPAAASLSDLIDLSEDADAEAYRAAIDAAGRDREVDGVLAIYSPKPALAAGPADAAADAVAEAVVRLKDAHGKPLLGCWMGDASVGPARERLNEAGVPTFRTPEAAVGAFGNIASFYRNQQLLQQTPPPLSALAQPDIQGARIVLESVLAERRQVLTEMESKTLLAAFHVPVTQTLLARSPHEAMMIATQLGFPVALKIDSPDIAHKSDVQGVALNVLTAAGARDTYADMVERVRRLQPQARINGVTVQKMARARRGREVHVGLVSEPPFGPVIVFGAGGTMIELIGDRAMELPPLNQYLALRLIERSRVAATLAAGRGAGAADLQALAQVLLRVSEMVCELPELREMDINPIIVDEHGAVAVDARIVVGSAGAGVPGRPSGAAAAGYHHLAILPYPAGLERVWPLRGGGEATVRAIRPDDASMLQDLVTRLSPQSRYFRFVSSFHQLPPSMLARFALIDYDREMALVALTKTRAAQDDGAIVETERIVGVSRYVTNPDRASCEFSLLVADDFAGRGLGSRLMEAIMQVARDKGLTEMQGLVLRENAAMLELVRRLGFTVQAFPDDPDFRLVTHAL